MQVRPQALLPRAILRDNELTKKKGRLKPLLR